MGASVGAPGSILGVHLGQEDVLLQTPLHTILQDHKVVRNDQTWLRTRLQQSTSDL